MLLVIWKQRKKRFYYSCTERGERVLVHDTDEVFSTEEKKEILVIEGQ